MRNKEKSKISIMRSPDLLNTSTACINKKPVGLQEIVLLHLPLLCSAEISLKVNALEMPENTYSVPGWSGKGETSLNISQNLLKLFIIKISIASVCFILSYIVNFLLKGVYFLLSLYAKAVEGPECTPSPISP